MKEIKWAKRKREKPYEELWLMLYGFEDYPSGIIYRHQKAQERVESLETTVDVLNKRIIKLEKDIVKLAESGSDSSGD